MKFGEVIEGLKVGKCYQRAGWNGKGLFICKLISSRIGGLSIDKIQSLPAKAKELIQRDSDYPIIDFTNQMLIINQSGRADSWVPSSSDIFADDWLEVL